MRLILPEPHDRNLERLSHIRSGIDFRAQIMRYANLARENNSYSLRFCRDFLGVSLLFCNPDSSKGWVQIGIILPEMESSERWHFCIYKSNDESGYCSLYITFERIWNNSSEQTEQEAFEEGFREG
jgi:hypothetical protein